MKIKVNEMSIIKTKDLLKNTMKDNDFCFDIYFRMAVIDEYLKGNDNIWNLYDKMQNTRVSQIGALIKHMKEHKDDFISLIESVKNDGYNINYPILINDEGVIIDGAHRMATALYFKVEKVSVLLKEEYKTKRTREYREKWFKDNNLFECITLANIQKEKIGGDLDV